MTSTALVRTRLLAAGLALTGAGLAAAAPSAPLLASPVAVAPVVLASALAVLFLVTDLCLLHIEVRREAMSVTMAGLPLALGLLLCGPRELVVARLVGSAVAFVVQRTAVDKIAYNLAAYLFDAALGLTLVHLLLAPQARLTVHIALVCLLLLVVVDQLMGLLVVQVITWHQGRPDPREVAGLQLCGLVGIVLATTGAYGALLLSTQGAVGVLVLAVFLVTAATAYRSFQVLHRRHRALAQVQEFVALNDEDTGANDLAGVMLEQVRDLMRARAAEVVLTTADGWLHLTVEEGGAAELVVGQSGPPARDLPAVLRGEGAVRLSRRTRDRSQRAWLEAQRVREAVLAPLSGDGGVHDGALLVLDRLGNTGSFTDEDQTLLATLAGYFTVAVASSRRRERLRYEATHDVLTGLGNRALLGEAISRRLRDAGPAGAFVVLLDLDRFKEVNDTLGHHVGDALLQVVADRLREVLPDDATVARLGGDEFAALVPQAPGTGSPAERAQALACQVASALAQPVPLPEATLTTRASIGVALAGPDADAADLLRHADTAMYAAKERGRGSVALYTPELDQGRAERLALLADLHLALERDELSVLYQPKLDLTSGRVTSLEALVRWQHPRLGQLAPDAFIPLAEANGLIGDLTTVVLDQALRQCAAWRAEGLDVAVAVNLSARTVNDPRLPERVTAALLDAGVPPTALILEITESAVMDDPSRAVTILERIAAIGVSLSLDDFGTGYSSLSYLQELPVREVKIDRSFITGLTAGARSQVLVRSIISLAGGLGLRVVAEGVEDGATQDLLREMGCDLAQGYHVSRPQAAHRLAALLHPPVVPAPRLHVVPA